ncbi:hypothetical protein HPG69_008870 [Diceros bicornis minor]|uniref:EF-hand domain-containing protein n=1 Tax=Diceros bicornis minor TaxID=77932 RepID=A0A7J7FBW4_DICBM|nr:hypothetical protein HPG69_008870 [Diceros bicornis minor]
MADQKTKEPIAEFISLKNGDGTITTKTIGAFLHSLSKTTHIMTNLEETLPSEEDDEIFFRKAGTDGNGEVHNKELIEMMISK